MTKWNILFIYDFMKFVKILSIFLHLNLWMIFISFLMLFTGDVSVRNVLSLLNELSRPLSWFLSFLFSFFNQLIPLAIILYMHFCVWCWFKTLRGISQILKKKFNSLTHTRNKLKKNMQDNPFTKETLY